MGLLDGKRALVFGVANDHSIAWAIARALHEHGAAEVGFSSIESLIERRVRPLARSIGAEFVEPCDVRVDADIARVIDTWAARHPGADGTGAGTLDIVVHALAYANREDLDGRFVDTSRDGFALAMDVSAYSLVGIVREATRVLANPSSVMSLTYYGAEKVVQHYNVMGVAKAALEASTRYLAADLGPQGVRVNTISAGPVRTLSAAGISGFRHMHRAFRDVAPLRSSITTDDVAGVAVWLASDLSRQVTGETVHVDGGFNILGVSTIEM